MVASKRKLPAELMLLLADDQDESVRRALAYNRKITREVLQKLAADKVQSIAQQARERLAEYDV